MAVLQRSGERLRGTGRPPRSLLQDIALQVARYLREGGLKLEPTSTCTSARKIIVTKDEDDDLGSTTG